MFREMIIDVHTIQFFRYFTNLFMVSIYIARLII